MEILDVLVGDVTYSIEVEEVAREFNRVMTPTYDIFRVYVGDQEIPIEHLSSYVEDELYSVVDSIAADRQHDAMVERREAEAFYEKEAIQ